ncbi:putative riboflavin biosynthesis protein Rib7 [Acephala macrosclerotiorum]|nr:putative riboflavin biosynthesis protein Rib7 [Acephala macrosclerotiorum]
MASSSRDVLQFPESQRALLEPHLPPKNLNPSSALPFVTLTFATSLDSQIALAPGVQTALSGPQSKAMTHYLRSRHDAILIGVNTAVVDNPSLNCRLEGVGGYGGEGLEGQPRPIVVDPYARWDIEDGNCKVLKLAAQGKGKAPFIITTGKARPILKARIKALEDLGGKFIFANSVELVDGQPTASWPSVFEQLKEEGLMSVMVEGGAGVINPILSDLRAHEFVSSVIVTIAPTWLGEGGVTVMPQKKISSETFTPIPAARLKDVKWIPLGEDVVLCGRLKDDGN